MKREGTVPQDRWTAVYVASLRGGVSAGPGRDEKKAVMVWTPSRCEMADVLTKPGLASKFREFMCRGLVRFHEASA